MSRLTAENYYEDGCPPMDIPLDVRLGAPRRMPPGILQAVCQAKTAEKF